MSFRRHTFPEVLDSLLTDVTAGVAAEPQPFPPTGVTTAPFQHTLLRGPVASVISIYGARDSQPHTFAKDKDYKLVNGRTIEWQKSAELPDPGTIIYINYYPQSSLPVLTDIETGSVIRTLSESVGLEIASLSAQLDFVYQSAFINTATGSALDNVVALLGIQRVTGGSAAGEVEFSRASGSAGTISLPAGTRIATVDGKVNYETTEEDSLAVGQNVARIPVRDLDAKNDPLPAAALSLLPVPIAGIGSVTNPAPTARLMRDETDDELRTRAKNFLHGSERATLGSIKNVLAGQGIAADVVEETTPGYIDITPHVDVLTPEARQRLLSAVEAVRPAGIIVRLKDAVPPTPVNLSLRLSTSSGLVEKDLRAVQRSVQEKVTDYFSKLGASDEGSINRLIGIIQGVSGVEDIKIVNIAKADGTVLDTSTGTLGLNGLTTVLGSLQISDPGLPTSFNIVVTYPDGQTVPDQAAIQQAWNAAVSYINTLNATELPANASAADQNKRKLSYGKLLLATPLPNKPATTLSAFDAAPGALPTDASISPYKVQFVFTTESGFSRILAKSADPDYVLTALERLSISGLQVQKEGQGA